ncbi:MAG: hypothetical protein RLZZ71_2265 [Bacteroidota bacterium]|jgi:uncharacterized protein YgiM (DUF1202 family)
MKFVFSFIVYFSFFGTSLFAQQVFEVQADSLNIRKAPNSKAERIGAVRKGELVDLLDSTNVSWYKIVSADGEKGYVLAKYILVRPDLEWKNVPHNTGEKPECENISEQFEYAKNHSEYEIKNNMFSDDAIVKLYRIIGNKEVCIRSVFVKHKESFIMTNIPLDFYKVRYATGSNFVKQTIDGKCKVKFLRNPNYYEVEGVLDFKNFTRSIVLYEIFSDKNEKLDKDKKEISEDFFNK